MPLKPARKRKRSVALIAAAITLALSATALGAARLLDATQVAEQAGDSSLAKAFAGEDAVKVNQSAESGGFRFTLHGLVSGRSLSSFAREEAAGLQADRTYAVVSIARTDGKPMPATSDDDYGKTPFFVSPLIRGEKPWQVNIASMKGAYHEFVQDGVQYRLIECDGIEPFADKGLYLAVNSGTFYDKKAFTFDEKTGEIALSPDYSKAHALFPLPVDPAKADPAKAQAYLKELLKEPANENSPSPTAGTSSEADKKLDEAWRQDLEKGTLIPDSVKVMTLDEDGLLHYDYKGQASTSVAPSVLFKDGQTGDSEFMQVSGSPEDGEYLAMRFHRDENGVITGRMIRFHSDRGITPPAESETSK